ncbi:MAG: hypothetical protein O2924_04905 [Chloroflexi bacterium]|nr:hypothetical protein [Chloroflexota bacterium]
MATPYAPRSFFRQIANSLLQEYFKSRSLLDGFNWDGLGETDTGPVYDVWLGLPQDPRVSTDADFQDVHELDDVDLEDRGLTVRQGKNRCSRRLRFTRETRADIQRHARSVHRRQGGGRKFSSMGTSPKFHAQGDIPGSTSSRSPGRRGREHRQHLLRDQAAARA